jgi:hypothetical protein
MRRLHRIRPSVRIVVLNRVSVARRNTQAYLLLPPVHPEQGYQRGQQRGPEGGADGGAHGVGAGSACAVSVGGGQGGRGGGAGSGAGGEGGGAGRGSAGQVGGEGAADLAVGDADGSGGVGAAVRVVEGHAAAPGANFGALEDVVALSVVEFWEGLGQLLRWGLIGGMGFGRWSCSRTSVAEVRALR